MMENQLYEKLEAAGMAMIFIVLEVALVAGLCGLH
jgi:hypothetical protein